MALIDTTSKSEWLPEALLGLKKDGYAILTGALSRELVAETCDRMYKVQTQIRREIGDERLKRANEIGVLRLMMVYDPFFIRLLEIPALLRVIDAVVGNTAVMHLQNGFILPSFPKGQVPTTFQSTFHRDFPRVLNGFVCSVNLFFCLTEFTRDNGATLLVPGSHQKEPAPPEAEMRRTAVPGECPAGSVIAFDSTLIHAAGANTSGADRLAINHQYTRAYLKQQMDYVRALGDERILAQSPRTQQLLGYYTRLPTTLDEYYQPEEKRLYRKGQG